VVLIITVHQKNGIAVFPGLDITLRTIPRQDQKNARLYSRIPIELNSDSTLPIEIDFAKSCAVDISRSYSRMN